MTKEKALNFKFINIKTNEFAIIEKDYLKDGISSLNSSLNFRADPDKKIIGVKTKFQFEQKEKPILIIAITCTFGINNKSWQKILSKESNALVLPKNFAAHLVLLAVGTTRGVLHEKTENTPFNRFILPPINVTKLIKEDVTIKLAKEEK